MMTAQEQKTIRLFNEYDDEFCLVEPIAAGGTGIVYIGKELSTSKNVAIKVLYPSLARNQNKLKRFKNEFEAIKKLRHEAIVTGFQYKTNSADFHYIVMEHLQGGTLLHLLEEKGRVEFSFAYYLLKSMLDALGYAHEKGFIHRDIKPSNILFGGDDNQVKIVDFGIVKDLQGDNLTQVGNVLGSYGYMPLELLSGKSFDHTVDIYSLGIVIFTAITGRLPFPVDQSFFHHIVNQGIPLSTLENFDIPPLFIECLERMTAKEPQDRVQSCAEIIKMIAPLEEHLGRPSLEESFSEKVDDRVIVQPDNCNEKQFAVSKYPVTHFQYERFLLATGHCPPSHFSMSESVGFLGFFKEKTYTYPSVLRWHPVYNIGYEDACAYARWAGGSLPSVKQWEITAGVEFEKLYPWGDKFDDFKLNAFSERWRPGNYKTLPVNFFPGGKSEFGCFDMSGNLSEWCQAEDSDEETAPLKGGNYKSRKKDEFLISHTKRLEKSKRLSSSGFRLVFECEKRK